MNRVFKVIWCEALNAYVVAGEFAKCRTKSASMRKLIAVLVAGGMLGTGFVNSVDAADSKGSQQITITDKDTTGETTEIKTIFYIESEWPTYPYPAGGYSSISSWSGHAANNYDKIVQAGTSWEGTNNISLGLFTNAGYALKENADGDYKILIGTNANPVYYHGQQINGSLGYDIDESKQYNYATAFGIRTAAANSMATAWGLRSVASGVASTAFGNKTIAKGDYAVAWGEQTKASGNLATSWGSETLASGRSTTAWGTETQATSNNATAWGWQSIATGNQATAWGSHSKATGYQSTAWGSHSEATGDLSTAFGNWSYANAKNSLAVAGGEVAGDATNGIAIGWYANSTIKDGIALGNGSVTTRTAGDTNAYGKGDSTGNAWVSTSVALAVGKDADVTRQITGVAAGSKDTDAVNVAQLKRAMEVVDNITKPTKFAADAGDTLEISPSETLGIKGDSNITTKTDADGKNIQVTLNKDLQVDSVTANKFTAGDTVITNNGLEIKNGPSVTNQGINAGDKKVTNVADGEISATSKDAVNGSQLHAVATEAGKHTTLSDGKNTTVESTVKDGQIDYKVNVAGDLTDITSVANGDSKINLNKDSISISNGNKSFAITNSGIGMSYITADYSAKSIMLGENGTTISGGLNVAGSKITGVAAGVADTDAVNVGQLKEAVQAGNTDTHIKAGEYGVGADNTVKMDIVDKNGNKVDTVTITDVAKASDVGNVNNIASDIKNQDGSHTTVVDAVNNLNNKLDNKVGDLNYVEGGKGNYVTNGENTTTSIGKLDQALKDVADTANQGWNLSTNGDKASKVAPGKTVDFSGDKNIKISNDGTNVKVELNNDIKVDTVTAGQTVMDNDGLKVGQNTSLKADELKVDGKTYIDKNGLNANGNKITGVAEGKENTDAVNVGQLKDSEKTINNRINGVENQVISNSNRINQLGNRVNKVGAGAAALAALHPMDFDPDDKLTFSAGYGNYGGENAAAIAAYYRPDEKVMFSVGGTVGNGENMVNAGVSFSLDRTNHVSNSRTAMAREILDLRAEVTELKAMVAKGGLGSIAEDKMKIFPDVAENHWAYEYIGKLAAAGIIEGYPDGNFNGDRMMSRYEFAAMLYHAMQNGVQLDSKIINEFMPEMGRIRVDRISGNDGDRHKIERVRVNGPRNERDHYGSKLGK